MDWKKIRKSLLFPPGWIIAVMAVVSAAALIYVFRKGYEKEPIASVVYVLAFYTLAVICIFGWAFLSKRYKDVKQKVYRNPLGNRYMTDVAFKNRISLYCSFMVNLFYVGINMFSVFLYHSIWFGIFAGYYTILAVMRFLLVCYIHKNRLNENRLTELQRARICAAILTTVNLVLFGAVLMILYQNKGFEYHGVLIYIMAMYTFYVTITAVIELVKYRKYHNPILSASKVIKMAAALVSMLSLETAMLSQFGSDTLEQDRRTMVAATGIGVSAIVIAMTVYMIVRTTREIKEIRRQGGSGE
ncbi:MAG: hypothetical protein K2O40_15140 [Lachnospiraceae bacterium]|nr:hypothetical protein [Lachnospiraceae bacterium]